jgi:Chemotaxis phosphatase CheX
MKDEPVSKLLVMDDSPSHAQPIKQFCDANGLVALKVRRDAVMAVLRTNIDLGGILYSESYGGSPEESMRIAAEIHRARPELPIIVRRDTQPTLAGLPAGAEQTFCAAYVASDMVTLRKVIDEYIFCLMYPNALLRGISEITTTVLSNQFKGFEISLDTPYIVRDRVIFGELFSLMPLESAWCRGYMMLQTEEAPLVEVLARDGAPEASTAFRKVNDLLGEITNLVWGAFKNRYIGDGNAVAKHQVQVPLLVNHKHKYISFGSENPQLCFRYTLRDKSGSHSLTLYQRFAFNLAWSPDEFAEISHDVAGLVESGEMELF